MAGAGKKRQQADRRRGGQSRPEASTATDPPREQPQTPAPQVVQTPEADRPFGLDGGTSPPGSARQRSVAGSTAGAPAQTTAEPTRRTDINRLLDLPPAAYNLDGQVSYPVMAFRVFFGCLPRRRSSGCHVDTLFALLLSTLLLCSFTILACLCFASCAIAIGIILPVIRRTAPQSSDFFCVESD